MICPMVPFPVILSDPKPRFQGHGVIFRPMNALNVLCVQLTRDLFAIAKFLFSQTHYILLSQICSLTLTKHKILVTHAS